MLYDILIIDDDFSGSFENEVANDALKVTILPLYFELVRKNLKVIWTTGDKGDLGNLKDYQLSSVKHIICDLHLSAIRIQQEEKTIVSTIRAIIEKLNGQFKQDKINFWINSNYIQEYPSIVHGIEKSLQRLDGNKKFVVSAFDKKNAINNCQKKELINNALLNDIKIRIINKHIELDNALGELLDIDKSQKNIINEELMFSSKHKIVKNFYDLAGSSRKINLFNEMRNKIAHQRIDGLIDYNKIAVEKKMDINSYDDLINCLDGIDSLIKQVEKAEKKIPPNE